MNLRHFVFQPTLLLLCLVRSHLLYSSDQRPLLDYRCALSCLFLPVYTKRQIALNWARVQLPCSPQGISYALTVTWSGIYMALALPHHETGQRRWVVPIRHRFLPGMADNAMTDGEPNWDSMPPPDRWWWLCCWSATLWSCSISLHSIKSIPYLLPTDWPTVRQIDPPCFLWRPSI